MSLSAQLSIGYVTSTCKMDGEPHLAWRLVSDHTIGDHTTTTLQRPYYSNHTTIFRTKSCSMGFRLCACGM
jgi:hypothetical protein